MEMTTAAVRESLVGMSVIHINFGFSLRSAKAELEQHKSGAARLESLLMRLIKGEADGPTIVDLLGAGYFHRCSMSARASQTFRISELR